MGYQNINSVDNYIRDRNDNIVNGELINYDCNTTNN